MIKDIPQVINYIVYYFYTIFLYFKNVLLNTNVIFKFR